MRVTAEKGDEVSFTAASTDGADHRAALSAALAAAGCPVLSLTSQQMSLEDVFLQLTENDPALAQEPEASADSGETPAPETPADSGETAVPEAPQAQEEPSAPETHSEEEGEAQ